MKEPSGNFDRAKQRIETTVQDKTKTTEKPLTAVQYTEIEKPLTAVQTKLPRKKQTNNSTPQHAGTKGRRRLRLGPTIKQPISQHAETISIQTNNSATKQLDTTARKVQNENH
jgi:hypothetical protein